MKTLGIFLALQAGDCLTTWAGLRYGASELNPLMHSLMGVVGVVPGLLLGKILFSFILASFGYRLLKGVNWYFSGLLVWNCLQLARIVRC